MSCWEMEEPGWWINPEYGGIVREYDNKWYIYTNWPGKATRPYRTLKEAISAAEGPKGEADE